ncbi:hypothetical protein EJ110_NYTH51847 [Nymphaea thermarum]|nr:hypothetical protein EJ110_NYTH51847 [Nymphaea thermarum]
MCGCCSSFFPTPVPFIGYVDGVFLEGHTPKSLKPHDYSSASSSTLACFRVPSVVAMKAKSSGFKRTQASCLANL